jgi:hypothetical protein
VSARRRTTRPVPIRETPITTAGQRSKPVLGRPPDEEPVVPVDDEGALAIVDVPELEVDDAVGVPEL